MCSSRPAFFIPLLLAIWTALSGPWALLADDLSPEPAGDLGVANDAGLFALPVEPRDSGSPSLVFDPRQISDESAELWVVDAHRGVSWRSLDNSVALLGADGEVLWQQELPQADDRGGQREPDDTVRSHRAYRGALVPADGSFWLSRGRQVFAFSSAGQLLQELELDNEVMDLAVDSSSSRLWIATDTEIRLADPVSGARLDSLVWPRNAAGPMTALALEPALDPESFDALWVARGSELWRFTELAVSDRRLATGFDRLDQLVVGADDTVWAVAGETLVQVRRASEEPQSIQVFEKGEPISTVLPDDRGGLWVAGPSALAHLDALGRRTGEDLNIAEIRELVRLPKERADDPDSDDQESEDSPPVLTFLSPQPGATKYDLRPQIVLGFESKVALDLESLQIQANGQVLDVGCAFGYEQLTCRSRQDMSLGEVLLVASIANEQSLRSAEVSRRIKIAPPEEGEEAQGGGVEPVYTPVANPRGARPHTPFEVGTIDTIDTTSGNLTARIPLGQSYEVGPKLSYRFQVVHNSNSWDFVRADWFADAQTTELILPLANPGSNAGIGWEIHFGKLFAPFDQRPAGLPLYDQPRWPNRDADPSDVDNRWMYVAPDGARHYLYSLPGRDNGTTALPIRYSKEGAFLRLQKTNASTVEVEFADGTYSVFELTGNTAAGTDFCGQGASGCWRLSKTRDAYGNEISFSYALNTSTELETWTIDDSTGRSHQLIFSVKDADTGGGDGHPSSSTLEGDEPGDLRKVLKEAKLAAFGGNTATYAFTSSVEHISRPCPNEWQAATSLHSITVPVLERITPPEGVQPWIITSHLPLATNAVCVNASARVDAIQLPTLGKISYGYGYWRMPTRCTYSNSPSAEAEYTVSGIATRTTLDREGNVEGVWSYGSTLTPTIVSDSQISGPGCKRAEYRTTTVDPPAGDNGVFARTVSYNSVAQGPQHPSAGTAYDSWQVTDNGLPYNKDSWVNDSGNRKVFLSQQIYECTATSCTETNKQRSVYRRYTSEYQQCVKTAGDSAGCFKINPQQLVERTVFHKDGGRWVENRKEDNNGAGQFRVTSVVDNFDNPTGSPTTRRTTTTDYTATGSTVLSINSTSGYLAVGTPSSYLPAPGTTWFLGGYDEIKTVGDGRAYLTQASFNSEGSMVCLRKLKNSGSRSGQDVVVQLTLGSTAGTNLGLPVTEKVSGGAYGQAGTSGPCDGDSSTANGRSYTYQHTYSDLQLKTSKFSGFSHFLYEADIDQNTGLETSVYDVSGLRTGLTFDQLGRIRHLSPESAVQGAHTEYVYEHPANGDMKVEIIHRTPSSVGLAKESKTFDSFGRLISESRRKPVGSSSFSPSIRKMTYDALGRRTASTTWQASPGFNLQEAWKYLDYDAFDRARKIRNPDGREEVMAYSGIRQEKSTVLIRTSQSSNQSTDRFTRRDSLGRVIYNSNPEYATSFTYDPYNQRVSARRTGTGIDQTRSYGYDARGYLLSENLPEVGSLLTYQPDALGLARQTFDGLNTLIYQFDGAGRLTEVKDSQGQIWKEFAYGASNSGTNRVKGRLQHVLRFNDYSQLVSGEEDFNIIETFEYRGAHGKISKSTTKVHYPDRPVGSQFGAAFEQGFTWDHLGGLSTQSYPICVVNGDGANPCNNGNDVLAPNHVVTTSYNQGVAHRVSSSFGPSADLAYHFNFQLAQTDYGNGVTGIFAEGAAHMSRPRSIQYTDPSSNVLWESGNFTFDGVGNIAEIGSDHYIYDQASRMLSGTVSAAGANRKETLTYDAADNVTSFARDGGAPVSHNVDSATNRLLGRGTAVDIVYDSAGSVTHIGLWPDQRPIFNMSNGPFRRQTSFETTRNDPGFPSHYWAYGYGPGDVRIVIENDGQRRWTFRDPQNRVVREFLEIAGAWEYERDFIYAPTGLIATRRHNGAVRYFHADHLGTPRLFTAQDGTEFSRHNYYPFGAKIEDTEPILIDDFESGDLRYWLESQHEPRAGFTGHERDANGHTDYMLARTYLYPLYRFGSIDPARDGWNPYTYVRNNPVAYVDPDGRKAFVVTVGPGSGAFEAFGHSAIYVAAASGERAGISLGGNHAFEKGLGNLIRGYINEERAVRVTVLDTTPKQDAAMIDFLTDPQQGAPDGGTDRNAPGAGLMIRENCAQAVCNTLEAGGVLEGNESKALGGAVSLPSALVEHLGGTGLVVGDFVFSKGDEKLVTVLEFVLGEENIPDE